MSDAVFCYCTEYWEGIADLTRGGSHKTIFPQHETLPPARTHQNRIRPAALGLAETLPKGVASTEDHHHTSPVAPATTNNTIYLRDNRR